jgi:membrane-associated phospholipid phosphatase
MLMSTPTAGGHYLVDVIGGGFCAAALIWTHRRLA